MPTVAPGGSSARVRPSRATSASRGSSRGGTAAMCSPGRAAVGRSLYECTAKSISRRSARRAARRRTRPTPSRCTGAVERSPAVTTSTSSTGRPVAAVRPRRPGRTGPSPGRCPGYRGAGGHRPLRRRGVGRLPIRRRRGRGSRRRIAGGLGTEVEQLAQQGRVLVAAGLGGELAHPHGGRVQQPLHHPVHRAGHLGALLVGQVRPALGQPAQLGGDHLVGPPAQGGHGGRHVGAAQPGEEALDLGGHDLDGGGVRPGGRTVRLAAPPSADVDHLDAGQLGDARSTSRGTARSSRTSGPGGARSASAPVTTSRVRTGSVDAVAPTTMSTWRARRPARPSTAVAPYDSASRTARSAPRLVTVSGPAPGRDRVATASEPIAPAPTTRAGWPASRRECSAASSSAAVTTLWPARSMPVSACARLPTRSACCISSCSSRPAASALGRQW